MLARLQVRERLTLLVVVPLVAVAVLLVPLLAGRLDAARAAAEIARTAAVARAAGVLVDDYQRLRLLAVGYLASPDAEAGELRVALADADAHRVALAAEARAQGAVAFADELDGLAGVTEVGRQTVDRKVQPVGVVSALSLAVTTVVDGLALPRAAETVGGSPLIALDTLLRAGEESARAGAFALIAATSSGDARTSAVAAAEQAEAASEALGSQFTRLATPSVVPLYEAAVGGPSARRFDAALRGLGLGAGPLDDRFAVSVIAAARSEAASRQLVEVRVAQDVSVAAGEAATGARIAVTVVSGVAAVLFVLVVLLAVVVGRSVSRPLSRLTRAAARVADVAQTELLQVADEDSTQDRTPRLAAVEVGTADEIGALAEAFNRVQVSAALLLQRQVASRRNVATMFAGVGRRTSNLVGRQLALIDRLERAEDDPETLATLYRLDHVSTRLRRHASSLVVLSGATESSGDGRPVALADAVRGALGTVEEFQRVGIQQLPGVFLSPGAATDLVLLLAELMENAVLFSPPTSTVGVLGDLDADGCCVVRVVDQGIGMSTERFELENARLRQRERLDLAPSDVLGLFVVGRIARRHGLDVRLEPTPGHGVTAVLRLPADLLVEPNPAGAGPDRPRSVRRTQPVPAAAAAPVVENWPDPVDDARVEAARVEQDRVLAPPPRGTPVSMPPPPADDVSGIPRRTPGLHFAAPDQLGRPAVRRSSGTDADRVRRDVEDLEAGLDRAVRERFQPAPRPASAPAGRPGSSVGDQPAADATGTGPARPAGSAHPGLRRRVPGQALEFFDTTASVIGRPSAVDPDEVRDSLDEVGAAMHRAMLAEPERTVRSRRRDAEREQERARTRFAEQLAEQARRTAALLPDVAGRTSPPTPEQPVQPGRPAAAEPTVPAGLLRRRPGQALSALEQAERRRPAPSGEAGRLASVPERPDDVLAWVEDLDRALARAADTVAGPGNGTATEPPGSEPPAAEPSATELPATEPPAEPNRSEQPSIDQHGEHR